LERRAESGRRVEDVTEREIEFEQSLNRTAALECARDRNTPVQFVENEGRVSEAVEAVVETVDAR
jgi:adenylate kinase